MRILCIYRGRSERKLCKLQFWYVCCRCSRHFDSYVLRHCDVSAQSKFARSVAVWASDFVSLHCLLYCKVDFKMGFPIQYAIGIIRQCNGIATDVSAYFCPRKTCTHGRHRANDIWGDAMTADSRIIFLDFHQFDPFLRTVTKNYFRIYLTFSSLARISRPCAR